MAEQYFKRFYLVKWIFNQLGFDTMWLCKLNGHVEIEAETFEGVFQNSYVSKCHRCGERIKYYHFAYKSGGEKDWELLNK